MPRIAPTGLQRRQQRARARGRCSRTAHGHEQHAELVLLERARQVRQHRERLRRQKLSHRVRQIMAAPEAR